MKTKSFVAFCFILSFGLILAEEVKKEQPSGGAAQAEEADSPWNPLAELLGLKERNDGQQERSILTDYIDRHSQQMDSAIKRHQNIMDKAMGEHQNFFNIFDDMTPLLAQHNKAMEAHQKFMDRGMADHKKGFSDFNKDWEEFDKDMSDMFEEFDKHFEKISDPFVIKQEQTQEPVSTSQAPPKVETDKIAINNNDYYDSVPDEEEKAQNKSSGTGLPVFHTNSGEPSSAWVSPPLDESSDDQLPVLINHIMEGFKPMISDLQKEIQDRINDTYQKAENGQPLKEFTLENETKSEENSTSGMFSHFMDNVFDSFGRLGGYIVNSLVSSEDNHTMIVSEKDGNGSQVSKLVRCQCPDAAQGQHKHDCPMHGKNTDEEWPQVIFLPRESTVLEKKLKIAYFLHALENVLMGRITKLTYEDYESDLENLFMEGFSENDLRRAEKDIVGKLLGDGKEIPKGMMWSKTPWEVSDINSGFESLSEMVEEVAPVVAGRILSLIHDKERQEWEFNNKLSTDAYIGKQLKHEFIIKQEEDDYEWYEWVAVGLIAGTSSLLLIVALFMCVKRSRHSDVAKLSPESGGKNGVSNNNFNDKYKEKIKTFFVNIK